MQRLLMSVLEIWAILTLSLMVINDQKNQHKIRHLENICPTIFKCGFLELSLIRCATAGVLFDMIKGDQR